MRTIELGGYGCFFCGGAVRLQRIEADRIFYTCLSCHKWVIVRVTSKTDAKAAKIVGSPDHKPDAPKKNGGKKAKKADKAKDVKVKAKD